MALVRFLEILNLVLHVSWKDSIGSATGVAKVLDSSVKAILNIAQHYGVSIHKPDFTLYLIRYIFLHLILNLTTGSDIRVDFS